MHSELFNRLLVTREDDLEWLRARAGFSLEEDITQHDAFGIKNERSLTEISDQTRNWLMEQRSGWFGGRRRLDSSPENIAKNLRALAF